MWVEDDRDDARSFCLPRFSFVALCLSASNLQPAFLTDDFQLSRSAASLLLPYLMADSRLCKLSLQLIFVTLSWSTTIALSFLEIAEKKIALGMHPCDVAILVTWPAQRSCA